MRALPSAVALACLLWLAAAVAQETTGGNDRYVSVCRKEFKNVFFGGQPVKLIDPLEQRPEQESDNQEDLLE